ncbi:MAG: hypothetical protein ACREF3_01500 [Acetobacteraceae bacterium]
MTPSASIVAAASAAPTVTDSEGRRITLRRLNALDKLRLFKAAGPVLAHNQPWLGMAVLAYSVVAIDDIPVPPPLNEQQIEAMVGRLGDAGINAVAGAFSSEPELVPTNVTVSAGN